jgi:predicted translin family RNA/ssDNA-binding protein
MDKPNEEPQELSYKIANNTYATVTPMGNWLAMRDDRDRYREDWLAMVKQIEELQSQLEIYKDLYATEAVHNVLARGKRSEKIQ